MISSIILNERFVHPIHLIRIVRFVFSSLRSSFFDDGSDLHVVKRNEEQKNYTHPNARTQFTINEAIINLLYEYIRCKCKRTQSFHINAYA